MNKNYFLVAVAVVIISLFAISYSDDEENYVPVEDTSVRVDVNLIPYPKLSDYRFFLGELKNQSPNANVIPYEPSSTLFTDYAHKKRFIWMPAGQKASYISDYQALDFPIGTILIKTFYYSTIQPNDQTKNIETRIMIKKSNNPEDINQWIFAEYIWNDEQTEATLLTGADFESSSTKNITFKKDNGDIVNTNYIIPSASECLTCHKINEIPTPIALKPQNLNRQYSYTEGEKNILQKFVEQGYLTSYPTNIVSTVNYNDTSKPLELRVRSYLDINCAHCHQENGRCGYTPLRFNFNLTADPTNMGVCVTADAKINNQSRIISPGNFYKSILHYRMQATLEDERMPLLGRTIVHDEGVQLMEEYILSLTQTCE